MNSDVAQHLCFLGLKARDRVTGFEGVVCTVAHHLFGCVQAVLVPQAKADGGLPDGHWFDIDRLEVIDHEPVMGRPSFCFRAARAPEPSPHASQPDYAQPYGPADVPPL